MMVVSAGARLVGVAKLIRLTMFAILEKSPRLAKVARLERFARLSNLIRLAFQHDHPCLR